MTKEQLRLASRDLTLQYLQNYYAEWRLVKVLTNTKLLKEKYSFYSDIIKDTSQRDDKSGDATIAQEIKHGLHFDAIAQCVQYVEDLFALIKASKNPDYFIKNIVTYNAGGVTNSIKNFKIIDSQISEAFHFPLELEIKDKRVQNDLKDGIHNLKLLIEEITTFYKNYHFFYNQYKHGLAIGMRPFGNKYNSEQIMKDKQGNFKPYLVVYDNLNIKAASKKGTFNFRDGAFLPHITNNIMPFIPELENKNNLLRFVFLKDSKNFSIDIIVDMAYKIKTCIQIFIVNYTREIHPNKEKREFQLPADYTKNLYYTCTY